MRATSAAVLVGRLDRAKARIEALKAEKVALKDKNHKLGKYALDLIAENGRMLMAMLKADDEICRLQTKKGGR